MCPTSGDTTVIKDSRRSPDVRGYHRVAQGGEVEWVLSSVSLSGHQRCDSDNFRKSDFGPGKLAFVDELRVGPGAEV